MDGLTCSGVVPGDGGYLRSVVVGFSLRGGSFLRSTVADFSFREKKTYSAPSSLALVPESRGLQNSTLSVWNLESLELLILFHYG